MRYRVSNADARERITKRQEFTNATKRPGPHVADRARPGSFRAVRWFEGAGHLPDQYVDPNLVGARYIVYSYDTPIAWWGGNRGRERWFYASVAYSPTTSDHQHIVRDALKDEEITYVGGDWRTVPNAGRFWDGSPKINAGTGTPAGHFTPKSAS